MRRPRLMFSLRVKTASSYARRWGSARIMFWITFRRQSLGNYVRIQSGSKKNAI